MAMSREALVQQLNASEAAPPAAPAMTREQMIRQLNASEDQPEVVAQRSHGNVQPGQVLPLPGVGGEEQEQSQLATLMEPIVAPAKFAAQKLQTAPQDAADFAIGAGDFARDQAGVTESHYRNLANLPVVKQGLDAVGLPVDPPTPEAQSAYQEEAVTGLMAAAGGLIGRGLGKGASEAMKYLGRGGKGGPKAAQFIADNAVRAKEAAGRGVNVTDLLGPTIAGGTVATTLDVTDLFGMQPHELAGDVTAGGAGIGTAALVAKGTVEDLLLGNERWQRVMTRPSAGTASTILGALLGYGAARGLILAKDEIADAADWVAGLFENEDQGQVAADAENDTAAPPDPELEGLLQKYGQ